MRANHSKREAGSMEAGFLALLLLILIGSATWLFVNKVWRFPERASERAATVDNLFDITLVVTGIAFILVHGALAFFVFRFRERGAGRALYWHDSHTLEVSWTLGTAVILTVLV